MKQAKRLLIALLIVAMTFTTLVGCSQEADKKSENQESQDDKDNKDNQENQDSQGGEETAIPLTFTGVDVETKNENLSLISDINFSQEYGWEGTFAELCSINPWIQVNGTKHGANVYYLWNNVVFFEAAFLGVENPTNVKIAKGTQITYGTQVFEVAEDFEINYDEATASWVVYEG